MKSALLIIDVQSGLFDGEPRPFEADAVVARINALWIGISNAISLAHGPVAHGA